MKMKVCYFGLHLLIIYCMLLSGSHAKGLSIGSLLQKIKRTLKQLPTDTKSVLETLKGAAGDFQSKDKKEENGKLLEHVHAALEKLGTGDAMNIAAGCLKVVSGIASSFGGPVGLGIGAVASFISSILGLFTDAGKESIGDIIDSALKKYGDEQLRRQAAGAKRDFVESSAFISAIKKRKKLSESDLSIIAANVPIYKFSKLLGTLESRILKGSVTNKLKEAKKTVDFILLYSQLVVMRETILLDLSILYRKSGTTNHIADAVDNANRANKNFAKKTLFFLHNLLPEHIMVGAVYHPIENSKTSQSILKYAKYFGVNDVSKSVKLGMHRFQNLYWKKWYICSSSFMGNYMFKGCKNLKDLNIRVGRQTRGYYTMENHYARKLYVTKHAEGWAWGTSEKDPGPQGHLCFIPLKTGYYMITTEKWPNYFLYMESSAHAYIRSWKGSPGLQGIWNII